jgi:A/G-specific adenine glycosylase
MRDTELKKNDSHTVKNESFTIELLRWFEKNKRKFPWRGRRISAYKIALAEALLQKTSVTNALPVYFQVIERYPNIRSLAESNLEELRELLRPLGLPRRAILLHQLAREITEKYRGNFPKAESELRKLPGIGQYGAGAIVSQALKQRAPMIDINVMRIVHRVFSVRFAPRQNPSRDLREFVLSLIPEGKEAEFNLALLDFGALVCRARNPLHEQCPMAEFCDFNLARLKLLDRLEE